jgi:hypothetical protein
MIRAIPCASLQLVLFGIAPIAPIAAFARRASIQIAASPASLRSASALTTYPQAQQQQQEDAIDQEKVTCGLVAPLIPVGGLVAGGILS